MSLIAWLLCAAAISLVLSIVGWGMAMRRVRYHEERADDWERIVEMIKRGVEARSRYCVEVSDWGPEYTGADGTLPRFRWVVRDPFYHLKPILGIEQPQNDYLMLGNAHTIPEALHSAHRWIERARDPWPEMETALQRRRDGERQS